MNKMFFTKSSFASIFKRYACYLLVLIALIMSITPSVNAADKAKTNSPYIFVSGYCGWGQYDKMNDFMSYWGMRNGDLIEHLNAQGFDCYAASVDPVGSAWDRACELYAQLTGTVVDYGFVHSTVYNHPRFGTDYSSNPLITGWGANKKVNLIGHSFGGATIRLLSALLANGAQDEVDGTDGAVSGLFTGGKTDWINSITALSSPHNGATILDLPAKLLALLTNDGGKVVGTINDGPIGLINYFKSVFKVFNNGMGKDTGAYDLSLDGAAGLNEKIPTFSSIYYFSLPADSSSPARLSNNRFPNARLTDFAFWPSGLVIGIKRGVSTGGIVYGKSWLNNDGVTNTISCLAPKDAPQKAFDKNNVTPGIWQVMPTLQGDHLAITGGLIREVDVKAFYVDHMNLINSL
ncbi:MAG: hypothetical protein GXZ02_06605 [Clostridiales bacterium]|nr:hypothetical protein [Clostridiales bacterium]